MGEIVFGLKKEDLNSILKIIFSNEKVREAFLFGSRAKGNFLNGSDIDIAIKAKDLSFEEFLNLKAKLQELNIPQKIDLIVYENIENKDLKEHIDRVGIKLTLL